MGENKMIVTLPVPPSAVPSDPSQTGSSDQKCQTLLDRLGLQTQPSENG